MKKQKKLRKNGNLPVVRDRFSKRESRALIIGDTHLPFEKEGYLDFCIETYQNYNCNEVIHIGDVVDHHHSSYHESDPDGLGGGEELSLAIKRLKPWVKAFPEVKVLTGNHCAIIMRKAFSGKIPARWIKPYAEVLGAPGWEWVENYELDGVMYTHGHGGGDARARATHDIQSTVCGHFHTKSYIDYMVGNRHRVFAMQVGCGVDHNSYALAYSKRGKKLHIGCGVVIGGHTPHLEMMQL